MQTRTIQISRKEFDIEVEITQDGTPVEAKMIVTYMEDTKIDCLEAVKNSKVMMAEIQHQAEGIDWNDHGGGDAIESLKEMMDSVFGGESA